MTYSFQTIVKKFAQHILEEDKEELEKKIVYKKNEITLAHDGREIIFIQNKALEQSLKNALPKIHFVVYKSNALQRELNELEFYFFKNGEHCFMVIDEEDVKTEELTFNGIDFYVLKGYAFKAVKFGEIEGSEKIAEEIIKQIKIAPEYRLLSLFETKE